MKITKDNFYLLRIGDYVSIGNQIYKIGPPSSSGWTLNWVRERLVVGDVELVEFKPVERKAITVIFNLYLIDGVLRYKEAGYFTKEEEKNFPHLHLVGRRRVTFVEGEFDE